MAVTMADIQHLRKMTGAGMMDCKNALNEAGGDFDKAMEIIRKKGQAIAAKREDRDASEGCVLAKTEGNFGAVVALQCETDFVAKNEDYIALTEQILDLAMSKKPATLDELLALELNNAFLSQERAQQEQERIIQMNQEYQQLADRLSQEFMIEQQKLNLQMEDTIKVRLEEFNRERNYEIIFSNISTSTLIYAKDKYDITDEVVQFLNNKYGPATAITTAE
jgi:Skp family chaperone for outer membrane proteins